MVRICLTYFRSTGLESHGDFFPGSLLRKNGGVDFCIWAPIRKKVEVVLFDEKGISNPYLLKKDSKGYFSGYISSAGAGTLYKYRLDDDLLLPDPSSLYQPEGPHGYSEIVDLNYEWNDKNWKGIKQHGNIIYEMHIGTFTKDGTWLSAIKELKELKELGITIIEIMPISEFPGEFGWGYDGVNFFAPYHKYGRPKDLMKFIDEAHRLNIGVILDVVYNHFGPDGNYIKEFTDSFFSKKHKTDWGEALNYDESGSSEVRNFIKQNALYWIRDYHFDGLRLDATQDIFDDSKVHIVRELLEYSKKKVTHRDLYFVAENEPQHINFVLPAAQGGMGLNALWNDDFHHSAMVSLTGRNEAYYTDYKGTSQEFVSVAKYGFLYQGQWYKWQSKRRGTPAIDIDKSVFVMYLQNHDQIANSGRGLRINSITDPGNYKAATTYMILIPGTPMLFMGQEFASSSPFYYFENHKKELSDLILRGRKEFLLQFKSLATKEMSECLPDPSAESSFIKSKLNFEERTTNSNTYKLHKELIRIKKSDKVLSNPLTKIDGAVLNDRCFVIRFFGTEDRLLIVNLGIDLEYNPAPEPLLAPLLNKGWKVLFSTEHPDYKGCGTPALDTEENWRIPGHCAVLLIPTDNPELL